jgi:type II secretory pathway pseudopilin PulG
MKRRASRGFTYLTAIFVVALMGAGYAKIGEMWQTSSAREKELQLLYVGNQYRRAIERYYLSGPKRYPQALEDLLKDSRTPATQRYLRQLYPDPITGSSQWAIVKAPDGGIMGVYSHSDAQPIKKASFRLPDREFEVAKTYADWKFIYSPALQTAPAAAAPAAAGAPAAVPAPPAAKP